MFSYAGVALWTWSKFPSRKVCSLGARCCSIWKNLFSLYQVSCSIEIQQTLVLFLLQYTGLQVIRFHSNATSAMEAKFCCFFKQYLSNGKNPFQYIFVYFSILLPLLIFPKEFITSICAQQATSCSKRRHESESTPQKTKKWRSNSEQTHQASDMEIESGTRLWLS